MRKSPFILEGSYDSTVKRSSVSTLARYTRRGRSSIQVLAFHTNTDPTADLVLTSASKKLRFSMRIIEGDDSPLRDAAFESALKSKSPPKKVERFLTSLTGF
jgi:hypothetical protein